MALEFVTAKYSILITVDSLETELQIQCCIVAKLIMFTTVVLIYTLN